jgi:sulfur relay (sulfurtransferase) complex TusBCD TusD component (DsrE family)
MTGTVSDHNLKATDSDALVHLEDVPSSPPVFLSEDGHQSGRSLQDPENWPQWKKNAQILMVAFHSCVSTFMAAGIIPAYEIFAEQYGVTVPDASYLTSFQVGEA